jgi:hypothetical protein
MRCATILGALLLALPAVRAGAQLVRGVVVDSATGEPLPGVTVRLVDGAGNAVGGALVGDNGRFHLRATGPGRYAVHVKRVGYAVTVDGPMELAAADSVWRRISVAPVPVSLAAIQVTGRAGCEVRSDARQTLLVWEEARKALDATMVTRGARRIRVTVVDYDRRLDLETMRVVDEKREQRDGLVDRPYFSRPPESVAELGYMQKIDGELWLFAPDADVLLSGAFLEQHCLWLVPGAGARMGMIGLGFEPVESRRLPDIAGVFWLDVASGELRDLEYRYTGLPSYMPSNKLGGRVEFAALPNGGWLIRRWAVRAPILERTVLPSLGPAARRPRSIMAGSESGQERIRVTGIREGVGEIVHATTTTGEPLLGSPPTSRQAPRAETSGDPSR